jgi:di/tricarboxylate transporter
MLITIIILVLSAVFFVNGKIRSDLVALCALVALLIFQILTPDEALSGFSNSVVIMMVGLFVVGGDFPDRTCQNDQFTHSEISG